METKTVQITRRHALAGALLGVRAGVDLLHVPYRGAGQAVNALYAGDTDLLVTGTIEALPHVREGRLKAIAVTSGARSSSLPDVPAISEAVPGYAMTIWYAMFGPRNTPEAVVQRLVREVAPLVRGNMLATRMEESGATLLLDGPARLAERMRVEVPQWRERPSPKPLFVGLAAGHAALVGYSMERAAADLAAVGVTALEADPQTLVRQLAAAIGPARTG